MKPKIVLFVILAALLLAACGQKGDLYLPEEEQVRLDDGSLNSPQS